MFKIIILILFLLARGLWKKFFVNPYSEKRLISTLNPIDFANKYANNLSQPASGILKIYGNIHNKNFDDMHTFKNAMWSSNLKTLEIQFNENVILQILNPSNIEERFDRLVIWNADKIIWGFNDSIYRENITYKVSVTSKNKNLEWIDNHSYMSGKLKKQANNRPAIELLYL